MLGITAANAVGLIIDLIGRGTTNTAFIYEALIGLVDVGDDCTVGDVNTDIADFRSDNTVLRPVAAYWVDVTEQLETIRWVSSSSIASSTLVSSCRTSLGCVDSPAIDRQLELAKKAAKLRTKMMKKIRKINIEKDH